MNVAVSFCFSCFESFVIIQHIAKVLISKHTQIINHLEEHTPITVDAIKVTNTPLNFFNIEKVMFI